MAEKNQTIPLRRRDMGLTGAIIVLAQVLSSFQANRNLSQDIEDLKSQIHQAKEDRQKYFVKKEEFQAVVITLDKMADQLDDINKEIKSIKDDYVSYAAEDGTVSCVYEAEILPKNLGMGHI